MALQTAVAKDSQFIVISLAPDVCLTPNKGGQPVPYPITHTMDRSENCSDDVFFGGCAAFLHGASYIDAVTGDEAGKGGGIHSRVNTRISHAIGRSSSVFINGRPMVRTGDKVWMNQTKPAAAAARMTTPASVPTTADGASIITNSDGSSFVLTTGSEQDERRREAASRERASVDFGSGNTQGLILPQTGSVAMLPTVTVTAKADPEAGSFWSTVAAASHTTLGVVSIIPGPLGTAAAGFDTLFYLAEGDAKGAAMAALGMIPGEKLIAGAVKLGRLAKAAEEAAKAAREADEAARLAKAAEEAKNVEKSAKDAADAQKAEAEAARKEGGRIRGRIGKCGEKLAKMALEQAGYEVIDTVKNASDNGIDILARNPQTGDVIVQEVKSTTLDRAPGLSAGQAKGGQFFSENRLNLAAKGKYGAEAENAAKKVASWLRNAGGNVSYQIKEMFVDVSEGCMERKPSITKAWGARKL